MFFCCTLLACHEGRGRSPSVSGIGEKTDFLTFQLSFKTFIKLNNNADKLITAEVKLGQRPRTCGCFFLSECCMAQRRSLSGRSPFCQRKQSEESQIHWKSVSLKATNTKQNTQKTPTTLQSPGECRGGVGVALGRLDQGLVGNAESTHVNRPKGKAMLSP